MANEAEPATAKPKPYKIVFQGNRSLNETALRRAAADELTAFEKQGQRRSDVDDAAFQMELAYRKALRDAHRLGSVGDFAGRAEALKAALAIKDHDEQVRYQLGLAYIEDDQYDEARAVLGGLLEEAEKLGDSYVVPFSHYQIGRAFQLEGRREEARVEFERVLALPDQHGAHERARQALSVFLLCMAVSR